MATFDLLSDFHVELNLQYSQSTQWVDGEPKLYAWHKDKKSDVLVIAGDASNYHEYTAAVVLEAADYYKHVLFVDGNHEHYSNFRNGYTVALDMEYFRDMSREAASNITYLNGETTWKNESTLFIGANGWYDFSFAIGIHPKTQQKEWRKISNDPNCIRFGKKNRPEKLAERQADQLKQLVLDAQADDTISEIVIVTHTLPCATAFGSYMNPTHPYYSLNGAYGNAFMRYVWMADKANKIKTWCFGHTHERRDFFENGIHFVCNPRGYRGEKRYDGHGFNGIVQVDTTEAEVRSAFGEVED